MRSIALVALLSLIATDAATGAARAQAVGVPPIEQEPRPGVVRQREAEQGLTPSARQNRRQQQEVDQLYQELTGQNPNAPAGPLPPQAPPPSAGGVDQLYQGMTGQSPNAAPQGLPPPAPPPSAGGVNQLYQGMTGQNPNATR